MTIPPLKLFVATKEWQVVPDDAVVPPGLEIRMSLATGVNEARLIPAKPARVAVRLSWWGRVLNWWRAA